jgi:hypothetical protein
MALDEKYTKGPFHLWSPMRNGGKVETVKDPLGRDRLVVSERNVLPAGKKVTQSELKASDEQWVEWVDGGVVRNYPYPEMPAGSTDSPMTFLQRKINEAATSEEERLTAAVTGATSDEERLVEAAKEADK